MRGYIPGVRAALVLATVLGFSNTSLSIESEHASLGAIEVLCAGHPCRSVVQAVRRTGLSEETMTSTTNVGLIRQATDAAKSRALELACAAALNDFPDAHCAEQEDCEAIHTFDQGCRAIGKAKCPKPRYRILYPTPENPQTRYQVTVRCVQDAEHTKEFMCFKNQCIENPNENFLSFEGEN